MPTQRPSMASDVVTAAWLQRHLDEMQDKTIECEIGDRLAQGLIVKADYDHYTIIPTAQSPRKMTITDLIAACTHSPQGETVLVDGKLKAATIDLIVNNMDNLASVTFAGTYYLLSARIGRFCVVGAGISDGFMYVGDVAWERPGWGAAARQGEERTLAAYHCMDDSTFNAELKKELWRHFLPSSLTKAVSKIKLLTDEDGRIPIFHYFDEVKIDDKTGIAEFCGIERKKEQKELLSGRCLFFPQLYRFERDREPVVPYQPLCAVILSDARGRNEPYVTTLDVPLGDGKLLYGQLVRKERLHAEMLHLADSLVKESLSMSFGNCEGNFVRADRYNRLFDFP